jgi:hypothetical protein
MRTARTCKLCGVLFLASLCFIHSANAGMTVYGLKDIYEMRLEQISFFLFLLLFCTVMFRFLWNHAVKGFDFLPKIKFVQALCLALLFGFLMLLILAMISGIREVLTPEAWRRQGNSCRLNDPSQESARRRSLEQLRSALFEYARSNQGRFPPHDFVPEIPDKLWESPDQLGTHYIYFGGLTTNQVQAMLAAEPPNFGDRRFALLVSGEIQQVSSDLPAHTRMFNSFNACRKDWRG